ncbi:sensor histidine kinase [Nocardioides sp. NPDC057772]|uniref:sensor histidine kinase n=1 Tax=Nocardioides sp. NPDC057772 TaxID=3346245 RepID=UPI00367103F5
MTTDVRGADPAEAPLRLRSTLAHDLVLAGVLTLVTAALFAVIVPLATLDDPASNLSDSQIRTLVAVACLQTLVLVVRRVRPLWCMAGVAAGHVALILIAPEVNAQTLAGLVAAYTLGTLVRIRITVAAVAVAGFAVSIAAVLASWGRPDLFALSSVHATNGLVTYTAAAFVGIHVATQRQRTALEREQARATLDAHRRRAEAAARDERTRIARELHDIAAHHLSGIVVQAAALDKLIDRAPDSARESAHWIRTQGKATLADLRQVVGLLRDTEPGYDAPVPGLAALPALLEDARRLGTEIVVLRHDTPPPLPPITDISLYRIAQQALANARQHAPGAPVTLSLAADPDQLLLEVVNGPGHDRTREAGTGSGLIGMRERAALVGAELDTVPTPDGGWLVAVRVPVEEAR